MKAIVKYGDAQTLGTYGFMDVPEPVCGEEDVVIEVKAAAICGADMHHWGIDNGSTEFNSVRGHEFSGQIVAVGKRVSDWTVGQRVVSDNTAHVCGKCPACMAGDFLQCSEKVNLGLGYGYCGGFTKYCLIPGEILRIHPQALWEIPENVSYEEAAILDPICNAYKALAQESNLLPGENVVIFGTGPLGLFCTQMARIMGAASIVMVGLQDDTKVRFSVAQACGATACVNASAEDVVSRCKELCGGEDSIGLVVDCAGAPVSLQQGLTMLRKNGQLIRVGQGYKPLNFDINDITKRGLDLKGHMAYNSISWKNAIELLRRGMIRADLLITHRLGLSQWVEGFEKMASKEAIKVIFHYDCD